MPKVPTPPGVDLKPDRLEVGDDHERQVPDRPAPRRGDPEARQGRGPRGRLDRRGASSPRSRSRPAPRPWTPATLLGDPKPGDLATLDATPGTPGPAATTLRARATDSNGEIQPETTPWNRSGYLWNGDRPGHLRGPLRWRTRPKDRPNRNPPRRLLRLSVRALMVVVLVLAVVLGWFVHRAQVQREAVAAIEKAGGKVYLRMAEDSRRAAEPQGRAELAEVAGRAARGRLLRQRRQRQPRQEGHRRRDGARRPARAGWKG